MYSYRCLCFHTVVYTGCPRRNVKYFGRVFLMLNYTDITQKTYIQSWTVTEIMGREVWNFWQLLHTYWLPNTYWNWQEYVVSIMLISVLNIKLTCEWHKAIKLNYKNSRINPAVVFRVPSTLHCACISSSNAVLSYRVGRSSCAVKLSNVRSARSQMTTGRGGCIALSRLMCYSCRRTVRVNARCPHFSLTIISVTVQLWI